MERSKSCSPPEPRCMKRVLRFIDENCTRPVTVSELAAVAELSVSHLHAVFRRSTGRTPLSYLSERRMDVAERLIKETRLSVAEIAECCGFAEQARLDKADQRRRERTDRPLLNTNHDQSGGEDGETSSGKSQEPDKFVSPLATPILRI